jgi:L-threonylcarbamoyladenylate synthase
MKATLPDLDGPSSKVLEALLPGPYTFVVATSVPRPPLVGTADSLGVRVPDHPALLEFLVSLETPLAATSANLSGQKEATVPADVEPSVLAHCSIAFTTPGPTLSPGSPAASTVVDLRPLAGGGPAAILRKGAAGSTETLRRIDALF